MTMPAAPRVLPCGDAAVLAEVDDLDAVRALHGALTAAAPAGLIDVVPAARTVLVTFDPAATDAATVGALVRACGRAASTGSSAGLAAGSAGAASVGLADGPGVVEVPVRYDGPDLAEVGRLTGLGARGVVAAHTAQVWTVAFCGFAPGFGYLVGASGGLTVPRRASPRTRVPAGSIGLAGEFTGVYPRESPGGWQLLGVTDLAVWDPAREPPALLRPGVRVRFVERP